MTALKHPAALGALGGAGLGGLIQYIRQRDDQPESERPSILGGMVTGGLLGGAAGYAMAPPGPNSYTAWKSWADRVKQRDEGAQKLIDAGSVSPRDVNELQFGKGDLERKIESASQYRAQHPELPYTQDLSRFDIKYPVSYDLKDKDRMGEFAQSRLAPFRWLFPGSVSLNKGLIEASRANLPRITGTASSWSRDTQGAGNNAGNLFDVLAHEVKGHGSQILSRTPYPELQGVRVPLKMQQAFNYLTSPPEWERRIQAVKDYGQDNNMPVRSPGDFKALLQHIQDNWGQDTPTAPRMDELIQIPAVLKHMKPEDAQRLLELTAKLAPGIVQGRTPGPIKVATF